MAAATASLSATRGGGGVEPFYVPAFLVEVGPDPGSLVPVRDVSQVTYKDEVNQIDSFDLTLANADWRPDQQRYTGAAPGVSTAGVPPQVMPGSFVRLWIGYQTTLGLFPMLTGRVTSVTPAFGDGGITVTVRALSSLEAFRSVPKNRVWRAEPAGIRDSEIVEQIADEHRAQTGEPVSVEIPSQVTKDPAERSVTQAAETDIAFLVRRAKRRGYIFLFRESLPSEQPGGAVGGARRKGATPEKFLYFGPSHLLDTDVLVRLGDRAERFELRWGASLLDFRPTMNLSTNLWSRVTLSYWNRRNRTRTPLKAYTLDDLWRDERGLNEDLQPLIQPALDAGALGEHEVTGIPMHDDAEAQAFARNVLRENFVGLVTAQGTTVGQPELRAGSRVEVTHVGLPFEGSYFITSTSHTIDDGGYRTQFSARREQLRGAG
jgi:phage protein D